jgi:Uncharacterized low-complexity proteins
MSLSDELMLLSKNAKYELKQLFEKVIQYPLIILLFMIAVLLLIIIPHWQVSGINNATEKVTQENQDRATLAQILGGAAIGISLYYTWRRIDIAEQGLKVAQKNLEMTQKNAQDNLEVARQSQITELFTQAVDQLGAVDQFGNPAIEIRLGGIYALERIASESKTDYWPIIEILTAYVRKNSSAKIIRNKKVTFLAMDVQANESTTKEVPELRETSLDIQAILTVIKRLKYSFFPNREKQKPLDLQRTYLQKTNLEEANLEEANLEEANLEEANLEGANLQGAKLMKAKLERANLERANLRGANLKRANLKRTNFEEANLEEANLEEANLEEANLQGAKLMKAKLERANLERANLRGANLKRVNLYVVNLKETNLEEANLEEANLEWANLQRAKLEGANLKRANLGGAKLEGANLKRANLEGVHNLSFDQLSKVKNLYDAKIDEVLLIPLKEKYPDLFEKPYYYH